MQTGYGTSNLSAGSRLYRCKFSATARSYYAAIIPAQGFAADCGDYSILIVASTVASAQNWHVGDKIQGYDVDWYDATIVEVGTGDHAGQYLVKYDRFQGQKWLSAASIRTRPGMSPPSGSTAVVPPGRYTCYGYPASAGVFRWYLDLGSTTYQQRTPDLPAGHYGYDAAHSAIMFVDGPYANNGWFGRLQRTGGRDSIVLRAIVSEQKGPRINEYANIYCSN